MVVLDRDGRFLRSWGEGLFSVRTAFTSAVLLECAGTVAGVISEPAPEVLLTNFGSDGVECRLQFWIRLQTGLSGPVIESNVRFAIADQFRAADISIPYPQRDVHLHVPGSGVGAVEFTI